MIAACRCSARRSSCSARRRSAFALKVGIEQGLLLPRLALDLLRLREQVDEHRDLRAQHDRVDRLEHIVDRAHRIAAQQMLGFLVDRRQEDDRNALGLLAVADDLGGLITVHSGHVDVEQDDREFALQEVPKRLLAGARGNNFARDPRACSAPRAGCARRRRRGARAALGLRSRVGRLPARAAGERDVAHRSVHAYSAASSGIGAAAAAASRERATHTRNSASSSSMSTGFAI